METLKAGTLAYYRTVTAGWLPCKVLAVHAYATVGNRILARITGRVRHGELIDHSDLWIVPRACLKRRRGSYGAHHYIVPFKVQPDGEGAT
jgi:hypothetical protein